MQKWSDYVPDQFGNVVASPTITVVNAGTTTPATIYSDNGVTPIAGGVLTGDVYGRYAFYGSGRFDVVISGAKITTYTLKDIVLQDSAVAIAAVSANLAASSGSGLVGFSHANTYAQGTEGLALQGYVNVKNAPYNAVGDGVADDTTAIAAWLLTIAGKKGFVPFGTYLTKGNHVIASLTEIFGAGMGITTFKLANGQAANTVVFKNSDQSGGNSAIHLRDFTVDGNKANQTNAGQMGINFSKVSDSSITYVEVKNVRGGSASGIQWTTAVSNSSNTNNLVAFTYLHDNGTPTTNADGIAIGGVNLRVIGNRLENNSDTGCGLQGLGTSNVTISGNLVTNNAVGIAGGPGTLASDNSHISITGNVITGANAYGVNLQEVNDFTISGNTVNITGSASPASAIICTGCREGSITGNTIVSSSKNGIELFAAAGVTSYGIGITGNTVTNAQQRGISIDSSATGTMRDIKVANNTVLNSGQLLANTYDGLVIGQSGTTTEISVTDNIFSDNQGVPTQRWGINFAGTPSNCVVQGNTLTNNITGAINPAGTGHKIDISQSFTPAISIGGSTAGITYSTQVGRFTRIGDLVYFDISMLLTSKNALIGAVLITGLPFTTANISSFVGMSNLGVNTMAVARSELRGQINPNVTTIQCIYSAAGVFNALDGGDLSNTSALYCSGFFRT